MGHKINPTTFRINITADSKYQLRDSLLANIFIYRLIKNIIIKYSVPFRHEDVRRSSFLALLRKRLKIYKSRRKQRPLKYSYSDIILFRKARGKLVMNPFLKKGFLFSHMNISYQPSLYLAIFMLDGAAEHLRASSLIQEEAYFYSVTKKNTIKKRFFRFFKKFLSDRNKSLKTELFLKKDYPIFKKFYMRRLISILRKNRRRRRNLKKRRMIRERIAKEIKRRKELREKLMFNPFLRKGKEKEKVRPKTRKALPIFFLYSSQKEKSKTHGSQVFRLVQEDTDSLLSFRGRKNYHKKKIDRFDVSKYERSNLYHSSIKKNKIFGRREVLNKTIKNLPKIQKNRGSFPLLSFKGERNFRRYIRAKIIWHKNYFHNKLKTIRRINFGYLQKKKFQRFTHLDRAVIAKGILLYLKKKKKSVMTVSKPVTKTLNLLIKKIGKLKKFLRELDHKKERTKKLNDKILRFKRQSSFNIFKEKLKFFLKDRLNEKKSDVWGSRLFILLNNFNLLSLFGSSFYLKLDTNKIDRLRRSYLKNILCRSILPKRIHARNKQSNPKNRPLFFAIKKIRRRSKHRTNYYRRKIHSFFPFWFQNIFFFTYKKHRINNIVEI